MEARTGAMDVTTLLIKETEWIGGLAAQLIGDSHAAEDLAQDTRLAALQASLQGDRSMRPWLATVARNGARMLRRSEGSRRAREAERAAVDANDEIRTPEQMLENLETQELVLRLVRELPEELSCVLIETFVEDRSPSEIARLRGIPAGTVRWRKKEALSRLRERLETYFDGDRAAWLGALLPLAEHSLRKKAGASAAASAAGSAATHQAASWGALWITMSLTWKILTVSLVSLISLFVLRSMPSEEPAHGRPRKLSVAAQPESRTASGAADHSMSLTDSPSAAARVPIASKGAPLTQAKPASTAASERLTRVGINVVDPQGRPVADAKVRPGFSPELEAAHQDVLAQLAPVKRATLIASLLRTTDSMGNAMWETDLLKSEGVITFRAEGPRGNLGSVELLVRPDGSFFTGTIRLENAPFLSGQILHSDGTKPNRQMVFVVKEGSQLLEPGVPAFEWLGHPEVIASAQTEPDGSFRAVNVPEGRWIVSTSAISGFDPVRSEPIEILNGESVGGIDLLVHPPAQGIPQVLVLDSEGEPLLSARVRLIGPDGLSHAGSVSSEGTYSMAISYERFAGGSLEVTDSELLHRPFRLAPIPALPQTLEVRMRPVASRVERTFVLTSDSERAVTEHRVTIRSGESSNVIKGKGSEWKVSLPGGAETSVSLTAFVRGFEVLTLEEVNPDSLEPRTTLKLTPLPGITGQVLSDGAPIANATVRLHAQWPGGSVGVNGNDVTRRGSELDKAVTDDTGHFHVFTPEAADGLLVASSTGAASTFVDLGSIDPALPIGGVQIAMDEHGSLVGTCKDPNGEPVSGAHLVLTHPVHRARQARSRSDGTYRFYRLPAGEWYLREVQTFGKRGTTRLVDVPAGWSYPVNCRVAAGQEAQFDLTSTPYLDAEISGALRSSGARLGGPWEISISQANPFIEATDPFLENHEASIDAAPGDPFKLLATSRADATVVIRAQGLSGFFRRVVPRTDLPLRLDTKLDLGGLVLSRAQEGPTAGASKVRIHWAEDDWTFHSTVTLPIPGEEVEIHIPAGLVDLTWLSAAREVIHERSLEVAPGGPTSLGQQK